MPRPRKFDPDQAVEAAMHLFWQRGYDAVSFDDLVETTGASRRGLYSLWDGKEALFAATIARYRAEIGDHFFKPMEDEDAGRPSIEGFWEAFEAGARSGPERSCLIMRTANQPLAGHPRIGVEIAAYFDRFGAAFRHALRGAIERGEIADTIDPVTASRLAFGVAYAVSAVIGTRGFDDEVAGLIAAGRSATGVA